MQAVHSRPRRVVCGSKKVLGRRAFSGCQSWTIGASVNHLVELALRSGKALIEISVELGFKIEITNQKGFPTGT